METEKIYMTDMHQLECSATIMNITENNTAIILDQTVLYAQGGGQPCDTGTIESTSGIFQVESVKSEDGIVIHRGKYTHGSCNKGDQITCKVNEQRRILHKKYHSAGHVVDQALKELGIVLKPEKGYHYPEGAYNSYFGTIENPETLKPQLEATCEEILKRNEPTTISFWTAAQAREKGFELPDFIGAQDDVRIIYFGENFCVPCGGTHVKTIGEIEKITIRKIKNDHGSVRIAYAVES